ATGEPAQPASTAGEGQLDPAQSGRRVALSAFVAGAHRKFQTDSCSQRRARLRASPARARHLRRLRSTRRAAQREQLERACAASDRLTLFKLKSKRQVQDTSYDPTQTFPPHTLALLRARAARRAIHSRRRAVS